MFNKNVDETYKSKNIRIYKEYDRLVFTGTFDKEDDVKLILSGVFTNKTYNVRISKTPYTSLCVAVFDNNQSDEKITVNKYVNDICMKGKYYIFVKINGNVYDPNLYIQY